MGIYSTNLHAKTIISDDPELIIYTKSNNKYSFLKLVLFHKIVFSTSINLKANVYKVHSFKRFMKIRNAFFYMIAKQKI